MSHYLLDARTATPHFPGIGRYVTNLARAIIPLLATDERLTILHDPAHPLARLPDGPVARVPVTATPFSLSQQWQVPQLLRRLGADLYHSPYVAMPYRPGVPALLTVYDLIPLRYPAYSTTRARLFARWMTRLALRTAQQAIAISDFTRRDFQAEFRLAPERISAIPLAADPVFSPQTPAVVAAVQARYGLPQDFALYLGSNKPHKNLVRLVEAWGIASQRIPQGGCALSESANRKLVIAGAWDKRYPEARERASALTTVYPASSFQLPVWLGPVAEADLPALYSAAAVFVFPSLYEGFGLPVLEAMACGTPVVCSNTSSLPEVAGRDAALLVDPTDTAALAEALRRALSDDGLRAELRRRGLAQAARFTWEQTAAATLALYRETLS